MVIALGVTSVICLIAGLVLVTVGCVWHVKAHDRFDIVEMFDASGMIAFGGAALIASAAMAGVPIAHIIG